MPDASFGPLVSFFFLLFVLFDSNKYSVVYIGCMCNVCEKERVGGLGTRKRAQTMQDTSFGLLVSFFFLSSYCLILINILLI